MDKHRDIRAKDMQSSMIKFIVVYLEVKLPIQYLFGVILIYIHLINRSYQKLGQTTWIISFEVIIGVIL